MNIAYFPRDLLSFVTTNVVVRRGCTVNLFWALQNWEQNRFIKWDHIWRQITTPSAFVEVHQVVLTVFLSTFVYEKCGRFCESMPWWSIHLVYGIPVEFELNGGVNLSTGKMKAWVHSEYCVSKCSWDQQSQSCSFLCRVHITFLLL